MAQPWPDKGSQEKGAGAVKYDLSKLNNFVNSIEGIRKMVVEVGVMAGTARGNSENLKIGMAHEFGRFSGRPLRQRSFLRMPLNQKMESIVRTLRPVTAELLMKGKFKQIMELLGASCKGVVQEAFQTGGWGKWPKRGTPKHPDRDPGRQVLTKTGQLKSSIDYKVRSK